MKKRGGVRKGVRIRHPKLKSWVVVIDGSDLRFAVPRCWSGGDLNCRSSLWFLALAKGSNFQRVTALKPIRELFSERSAGKFWPKTAGLRPFFQAGKGKEDRRFESPPLHQRGTANRRSRSHFFEVGREPCALPSRPSFNF
jgi:hypothetical protein